MSTWCRGTQKQRNMADYNARIKTEKAVGQDFEKRTEK